MSQTQKQPTCAERVDRSKESRLSEIDRLMSADDEETREDFYDYGLAFDYVAPGTFDGQNEGYLRYQISCGGPSEEIRFYISPPVKEYDNAFYRAEFWLLDWFDGACIDVTSDDRAIALINWFDEVGSVYHAIVTAA